MWYLLDFFVEYNSIVCGIIGQMIEIRDCADILESRLQENILKIGVAF